MKTIVAMILLLSLFDASALEIKVNRMQRVSGYYGRFDLKTSLEEKVVLDCQSFIQGLFFGPVGENVIMLQEWECAELMNDMKQSVHKFKKHCLEIDFDRSVLDTQKTCP
jgi:hypothetical protein